MNVLIEARAYQAPGGVGRYIRGLTRELLMRRKGEYELILSNKLAQGSTGTREKILPLRHELLLHYWLNGPVSDYIKSSHPDVVHFTKADIPVQKQVPTVATIYDVIPLLLPEEQDWLHKQYWPRALRRSAQADRIITISETSKRDIIKYLGVESDKIKVTSLAVDKDHFCELGGNRTGEVMQRYGIRGPFCLCVAAGEKRKNLPLLIEAWNMIATRVPHQLILAGKAGLDTPTIKRKIVKYGQGDRVKWIDYVSYDDLPVLMGSADMFVWPSIYEGWGMPPLEAMSCGTPVIVSDGGALPEVVGSAGRVVKFTEDALNRRRRDENFKIALAQAMEEILADESQRQQMREKGLEHVKQFTWTKVATETEAVYQELGQ